VPSEWLALPYEPWHATCDTLHAHTQVLGKLAATLAPPEPQLQHAALRLSARGWETLALPAPDRSGAFVVALDLRTHEVVVEHNDGRTRRIPMAPDRPVGEVTRSVLAAVRELVGPVRFNPTPQETPWTIPLDEDDEHATYDPVQVAATQLQPLEGVDVGNARAEVRLERAGDTEQLEVEMDDLPPPAAGTFYELWLLSDDGEPVSVAAMKDPEPSVSTTIAVPAGTDTDAYRVVDVSVQHEGAGPAHSGESILRGTLTT